MLLNSHISAYATCLAGKVCGLVRPTSRGEDKRGARDKILNTMVACRACAGQHSPVANCCMEIRAPSGSAVGCAMRDTVNGHRPLAAGKTRWHCIVALCRGVTVIRVAPGCSHVRNWRTHFADPTGALNTAPNGA